MAKDFADISRLTEAAEVNATNKREALAKLMKAWESKTAKRALKGAGLSTMAVTLAACGGSDSSTTTGTTTVDTTPFSQADIDAATAPIQTQLSSTQAQLATALTNLTAATTAKSSAETALATLRTDLGVAPDATTTEMMNAITALEATASGAVSARNVAETALADLRLDLGLASNATTSEMMAKITALETLASQGENALTLLRTDLGLPSNATTAEMIASITNLENAATGAFSARDAAQAALATIRADLGVAPDASTTEMMAAITSLETAAANAIAARDVAQGSLATLRTDLGLPSTATTTEMVNAISALENAATSAAAARDVAQAGLASIRTDLGLAADATVADMISAITALEDNGAMVVLKAAAAAAGVAGTDSMTQAQLITALTESNDAAATNQAVAALGLSGINTLADLAAAYNALANPSSQSFSLTVNQDLAAKFTGGADSDIFSAVVTTNGGTGTTIQAGDSLVGGAGTDTLNISVSGTHTAAVNITAVQANGIENIFVSNFDTGNDAGNNNAPFVTTIDTRSMTGVQKVGLTASGADGDTGFSGMANFVAAEMRNGSGDLTLTYDGAQSVAGANDAQSLTVSNISGGTFTANGIETINVTSELSKSTITGIASNALKAVNISGSADLVVSNAIDFVAGTNNDATIDATINAASLTGKLTVTADENDTNIIGGSNDDTINMAGHLTSRDIINGGDGVDTLTLNQAALTTQFAQVSNVEIVRFNADDASTAAVAYDASKLSAGVTTIAIDVNDNDDNAKDHSIINLSGQAVVIRNSADDDANKDTEVVITGEIDTVADTVSVTLIETVEDANKNDIDSLSVAAFETVNLVSSKESTTTGSINNDVDVLVANAAKSVVVSGNSDLTIGSITGGAMTSFNASSLAAKLTATFGSGDKVTATAAQKDTTFNFGTTLNNEDTVIGGAGKDVVTAELSNLTATTGALKISGVETINLTTNAANTLNLSNVTGASSISFTGTAKQTITGLDLGTKIVSTDGATFDVTAASATGSNDTLTFEQKDGDNKTVTIVGKAVENLALVVNDTDAGADTTTFDVDSFEASTITIAQSSDSAAARNVDLGTLHKNITSVDAGATKGTFAASATNATAAVTFTLNGEGKATVTGSAKADTFNIASTADVSHAITGGDGVDTTNLAVAAKWEDPSDIATENLNISVAAGVDIELKAGEAFNAATSAITVTGGNSLSTFSTLANANTALADGVKSFDASKFGGNITVSVADSKLDDTVSIKGGALATDSVTSTFAAAGTYKVNTTGVETLKLTATNGAAGAATIVVDLAATSGVQTIEATVSDAETMTFDKVSSQLIRVVDAKDDSIVEAKLADVTGASDAVSFELKVGGGAIEDGLKLKTTDIETVNLKVSSAESVSLADLSMTAAGATMSLAVTGDKALTISALNADVTKIDASGMSTGGSVVQTGRSSTAAADYKGSAGADTFIMANTADVMAAGAGADTLDVDLAAVLGGIVVDLSQTDVVVSANGFLNNAVQSGFTNIDLSGYTGGSGAVVTAHKDGSTITGTAATDQIIGGAGTDVIIVATAGAGNNDVIDGGDGADTVHFAAGSNSMTTNASLVNVETITLGETAGIVLTNQTEAFLIVSGKGANEITSGSGADTIQINAAADFGDTITAFTLGAAGDKLDFNVAVNGTSYVEITGNTGAFNSATTRVVVLDTNTAAADGTGVTAAEMLTALTGLDINNDTLVAGDKFYAALTSNATTAATVEVYLVEVAAGGTTFETPTLVANLAAITDLTAAAAENFI